jgi:hypothetical protein
MRKHLIWILAVAVAGSAVAVAYADSTGTSSSAVKMKLTPSKLSKKKFKNAKLAVETSTLSNTNPGTPTHPGNVPVATKDVSLKFDKDIKFTSKGLSQCKTSLENTTTQTALSLCGKSKVGGGAATACISGGVSGVPCTGLISFKVTAFNGKPKGGKPTILLHSRNDANSLTTVLVGTLNPKTNVLDVPIPSSVYNLATITDFKTTVSKSYKSKGKKRSYVSARCSHKKLTMKGTFSYVSASEPTDHPTATSKCTGK